MAAPHLSGVAALMLSANSQGIVTTDIGLDAMHQGLGLPDVYLTVLNQATLSLASSATIPEPTSVMLITIGLLWLLAGQDRRRLD
jgi:hypothetical protein